MSEAMQQIKEDREVEVMEIALGEIESLGPGENKPYLRAKGSIIRLGRRIAEWSAWIVLLTGDPKLYLKIVRKSDTGQPSGDPVRLKVWGWKNTLMDIQKAEKWIDCPEGQDVRSLARLIVEEVPLLKHLFHEQSVWNDEHAWQDIPDDEFDEYRASEEAIFLEGGEDTEQAEPEEDLRITDVESGITACPHGHAPTHWIVGFVRRGPEQVAEFYARWNSERVIFLDIALEELRKADPTGRYVVRLACRMTALGMLGRLEGTDDLYPDDDECSQDEAETEDVDGVCPAGDECSQEEAEAEDPVDRVTLFREDALELPLLPEVYRIARFLLNHEPTLKSVLKPPGIEQVFVAT